MLKSRVVVLAHGWGLDLNSLNKLIEQIQIAHPSWADDTLWLGLEQGYFVGRAAGLYQFLIESQVWQALSDDLETEKTLSNLQTLSANNPPMFGIGHSLGFAKLLALPFRWSGLISLHGFNRFCKLTENQEGTSPKILKLMLKQFVRQPKTVLQDFLTKAGPGNPTNESVNQALHTDKLRADLRSMLEINESMPSSTPSLWLAASKDNIVPFQLTSQLSVECFGRLQEAGNHHLGPQFEPSLYTERLFEFVNECAAKTSQLP